MILSTCEKNMKILTIFYDAKEKNMLRKFCVFVIAMRFLGLSQKRACLESVLQV